LASMLDIYLVDCLPGVRLSHVRITVVFLSKKFYHYFSVLVGSRNILQCDFVFVI